MTRERTDEMEQTEDGFIRLRVKLKRGTAPGDRDEVVGELQKPSLDELKAELDDFHELLYGEANRARRYQPYPTESTED